jgi:hypothetical protein
MNSELATASAHRDTTMTTDEENSEICLKLLGLKRVGTRYCIPGPNEIVWSIPSEMITRSGTPAFTTWAERGLIIDALQREWPASKHALKDIGCCILTGILNEQDVRRIALDYIRSLP